MSIDLESRLRSYGDVLDAAIEFDLSHDIELTGPIDETLVPLAGSSRSARRTSLVAVAAAGLLIGGTLALLTDHRSASPIPAAESTPEATPNTTIQSPDTTLSPDDPSLWNPIRVAPGTVGWYELGDGPAPVPPRLTDVQVWTTDYTATFYRCSTYTVDTDGPICTGLIGGGYVGSTTFGGTGELGTRLGDMSSADLAWALAAGSLWGYDEMPSPPPTTPVTVGDHAGVMYSNADTTYLVWEQAPNVHLWIRATGWTIDEMVALALDVRPATLPDQLPLRIVVDTVDTSGEPSEDELVIGSHPGMPLCAEIGTSNGCVSLPPVSDVAMVVGSDGVGGPITGVAAVSPVGSTDRLVIDIGANGPVTVEPVVSSLGFQYSIYRRGTDPIIGGSVVAADRSVVATATLSTAPLDPAPTTTAGPPAIPGAFHPEEGSYVLQPTDFPSTVANKFKVAFNDLLAINGWTLVGQVVPEFPTPGTTIKIPPGWTEPETATSTTAPT